MSEPNLDALFQAVENDDLDGVKELLESGCDVNLADEDGETALFRANSDEMVRLLIDKGADVNHKDNLGRTVLFKSFMSTSSAQCLIDSGCDVNHVDIEGETALFNALDTDDEELAGLLVEKGSDVNYSDSHGNTALFRVKSEEMASLLIANGADVNHVNEDGETALFKAWSEEIASVLLEHGCDVNLADRRGETALFISDNAEMASLLISHRADVNQTNANGETVLFSVDSLELASLFLENGCDVNHVNGDGETALFRTSSSEIAQLLIENGCDVNHEDHRGRTVLFHTSSSEIAQLLIENGCDVNHVNLRGETALFPIYSLEIAQLLIEHGCDVNHVNGDGETALFRKRSVEIVSLLLENGCNVNQVNSRRENALFELIWDPVWHWGGDAELIRVLIEAGAEVNLVNIYGETPLSRSSHNKDSEVARLLLEHGANIDQIDKILEDMDEENLKLQDTRSVLLEYQKFHDLHEHKSVLSLISDDLEEISGCLSAEAYKSSCIMAGSVLETFLTDWLSEILDDPSLKHVDDMPSVLINTTPSAPLTKPLLTKPKNNKSWSKLNAGIQSVRCYHQQKALEWSQCEKMAGFIRDARNSVHGNAHSKSVSEGVIDAEKCQNVLDNLKAIIHSRYQPVERIESAQPPKDRSADFEKLIQAIQEENIELFDSVPLDDELISLEDKDRKTLCSYAAEAQNTYFLSKVLMAGADVNHADKDGDTPLSYAVMKSHPDVVRMILDSGGMVDYENYGFTPLFAAVRNANSEVIKILLDAGANVNQVEKEYGKTPLFVAARNANSEVIKVLLDAGANVNHEAADGATPLFAAARNSNSEVIIVLINAGADVNHEDEDGVTPLFEAAGQSNPEVIKVLLDAGAKINHVTHNDNTLLFRAAINSNAEVMELFLRFGLDVNHENGYGETPIFYAARKNSNSSVLKQLLDAGADVNKIDHRYYTPLSVASQNSNPDITMLLIKAGAKLNHIEKFVRSCDVGFIAANGVCTYPLWQAVKYSNLNVVKILLDAGADVNRNYGRAGKSILDCVKSDKILQELLKAGVDVNHVCSALFCAYNVDIARELLNAGADIHIVDYEGKTVFDCCKNAAVKRFLYAYDLGCTMAGHEKIMDILDEDIQEVAACITAKCYKAACIMCGSILETFLKDWLSEITGKDFNAVKPDRINPLLVDNRLLKKEDVNSHRLYNYILATKNYHERLHEDWQALYDKAVMIRDNRNKVHASLCEDTGYVFDKALCETVLENLKSIIRSRFAYY